MRPRRIRPSARRSRRRRAAAARAAASSGKIIVPQTRHYSWEKAADILGIGRRQPDPHPGQQPLPHGHAAPSARPSPIDLESQGTRCSRWSRVVGTTEEGAVDDVAAIVEFARGVRETRACRSTSTSTRHMAATAARCSSTSMAASWTTTKCRSGSQRSNSAARSKAMYPVEGCVESLQGDAGGQFDHDRSAQDGLHSLCRGRHLAKR